MKVFEFAKQEPMKNVCIYAVYCRDGILQDCDVYLLNALRSISSYLAVIINGATVDRTSKLTVADKIFIRGNTGFDVAAYKYALNDTEVKSQVIESDNLVLCNNSFFGPFIKFSDIFNKMSDVSCDFWGITGVMTGITRHIQSYFLVFRKKILKDCRFWNWWDLRVYYDLSYEEVLQTFENGLFRHLEEWGYKSGALCDMITYDLYGHPFESMKVDHVPIMKRKVFDDIFFSDDVYNALEYISETYSKDHIDDISSYADNIYQKIIDREKCHITRIIQKQDYAKAESDKDRKKIMDFIKKSNALYIFGAGQFAKGIIITFFEPRGKSKRLKGLVVSDNKKKDNPETIIGYRVVRYSDIKDKHPDIILGLGRKTEDREKIYTAIKDECNVLKLF